MKTKAAAIINEKLQSFSLSVKQEKKKTKEVAVKEGWEFNEILIQTVSLLTVWQLESARYKGMRRQMINSLLNLKKQEDKRKREREDSDGKIKKDYRINFFFFPGF
jgi:hypothetical protein